MHGCDVLSLPFPVFGLNTDTPPVNWHWLIGHIMLQHLYLACIAYVTADARILMPIATIYVSKVK